MEEKLRKHWHHYSSYNKYNLAMFAIALNSPCSHSWELALGSWKLHSDGSTAREGLLDPAEYQLLPNFKQYFFRKHTRNGVEIVFKVTLCNLVECDKHFSVGTSVPLPPSHPFFKSRILLTLIKSLPKKPDWYILNLTDSSTAATKCSKIHI